MALHRYGDFRVEVFYFDSPCRIAIVSDSACCPRPSGSATASSTTTWRCVLWHIHSS